MQLDADYLDKQLRTRRERWRLRLTALALLASAAMLGDLVAKAQPLEAEEGSVIICPDNTDQPGSPVTIDRPTLAKVDRDTVFKLTGRTLCSGEN